MDVDYLYVSTLVSLYYVTVSVRSHNRHIVIEDLQSEYNVEFMESFLVKYCVTSEADGQSVPVFIAK